MTPEMMATNHRYTVELRFFGRNIDSKRIASLIGPGPDDYTQQGEWRSRGGRGVPYYRYNGAHEEGFHSEWASLESGFEFLLSRLASKQNIINELIRDYEAVWWCGHFQSGFGGGPTLSGALLKRLGELGVEIYIDNYFFEEA
jgi:hypothetical protein